MTTPLQLILDAFSKYYDSLKDEEYYSYPKNQHREDYWSDTWFEFLHVEPFETFLPYIFHTGLLCRETWLCYKEYGNLPFSVLDKIAGGGYEDAVMDYQDTALTQPRWRGNRKFEHLIKTGATLQEFIASIKNEFESKYMVEAETRQYWKDYPCMQDKEIDTLFAYMHEASKKHKLGLS
jgi:hypothetical protein